MTNRYCNLKRPTLSSCSHHTAPVQPAPRPPPHFSRGSAIFQKLRRHPGFLSSLAASPGPHTRIHMLSSRSYLGWSFHCALLNSESHHLPAGAAAWTRLSVGLPASHLARVFTGLNLTPTTAPALGTKHTPFSVVRKICTFRPLPTSLIQLYPPSPCPLVPSLSGLPSVTTTNPVYFYPRSPATKRRRTQWWPSPVGKKIP